MVWAGRPARPRRRSALFEIKFALLDETAEVADRWFDLVTRCQVVGKHILDARLAALLLVHDLRSLLTFNASDFPSVWGIDACQPERIIFGRSIIFAKRTWSFGNNSEDGGFS